MKKIALILLTAVLVCSCKDSLEKPKKFLEKDKMTDLLYELTLSNAAKSLYNKDSLVDEITTESILKKYELDSLSFVQLNEYYVNQPEIYIEIFDSITKRFEKKIRLTEALPEDPRDSLDKAKNMKIEEIKFLNK